MRILGIDCGSQRTGYGVIESDGRVHRMVAAGCIATDPKRPFAERLRVIGDGLREVIRANAPEAGAVEEVFQASNAKSSLKLAHVRGVALLVLSDAGLDVGEYSALEVKKCVVGYGRAEKRQVQLMVRSILNCGADAALNSEDACDALAVAICHANLIALNRP